MAWLRDIESNSKSLSVLIGALGLMILAFVFYGIELYDFSIVPTFRSGD